MDPVQPEYLDFPCIICHAPPFVLGMMLPTEQTRQEYGIPSGAVCKYTLCRSCYLQDGVQERAEEIMLQGWKENKPPTILSKKEFH